MSVSVLLVLGDKVDRPIDNQIAEQWFSSYIGKWKEFRPKSSTTLRTNHVHVSVYHSQVYAHHSFIRTTAGKM